MVSNLMELYTCVQSSNMRVGDWVICIGNPLDLKQSATVGIISAHQRTGEELGLKGAGPFLQVDCAVNGGNSGMFHGFLTSK